MILNGELHESAVAYLKEFFRYSPEENEDNYQHCQSVHPVTSLKFEPDSLYAASSQHSTVEITGLRLLLLFER
jgi:hypothetical protein